MASHLVVAIARELVAYVDFTFVIGSRWAMPLWLSDLSECRWEQLYQKVYCILIKVQNASIEGIILKSFAAYADAGTFDE